MLRMVHTVVIIFYTKILNKELYFLNLVFRTDCLFRLDGHLQLHHPDFTVFMHRDSKILWQYVCSMGQEFERRQN